MFGILGKQAVSITDKAAAQIAKLMSKDGHQGLRIGVKKGGCAGMEYTMDYVSEVDPLDEVVEQAGARVMIAPMARRSSGVSHAISWACVATICPMMRGGTPNPLATRAMAIVASSVCAVSWPNLSDTPWTPIAAS